MGANPDVNGQRPRRAPRVLWWAVLGTTLIVTTPLLGIGAVALLSRRASAGTWNRWADIGNSFGTINSVFSGLALAALIVTFWVQFRELQDQRLELSLQRESLKKAQTELFRSAEANLRKLHVDLLKLAINDPDLAEVWPALVPGTPHQRNRQYLYANLIYQHIWLSMRIGDYTESGIRNYLRHLFTSPLMREYWHAAANTRSTLVPGTHEFTFAEIADEICHDYELVLANMARPTNGKPAQRRGDTNHWSKINFDQPQKSESDGIKDPECPP